MRLNQKDRKITARLYRVFLGLKFRVNCDEIQSDEEAADGFYTKV